MEVCLHVCLALGYADGATAGPNISDYFRGPMENRSV